MFLNCNNFHQFVHICFPVQRAFSLPIIHYFLHPGPRKQPDQAADAVSLLIFLFCSSRQNWVCLPVKICLKQNLLLFFFRADIGTSGLQFCDSPRSPLVFKGTQQSLKPHCSVFLPHCNLTLSRCLQHSIYCSAFLQNPGGKSSAPFSSPAAPASAVPPFSPVQHSQAARRAMGAARFGEHKGLELALFPRNAFPQGEPAQPSSAGVGTPGSPVPIPLSRSPGPVPGSCPGRHRRALPPGGSRRFAHRVSQATQRFARLRLRCQTRSRACGPAAPLPSGAGFAPGMLPLAHAEPCLVRVRLQGEIHALCICCVKMRYFCCLVVELLLASFPGGGWMPAPAPARSCSISAALPGMSPAGCSAPIRHLPVMQWFC